jgi:DNA polymerase-1
MDQQPPLLLVDGYAQIYRGFHAIPGLTTATGQPTNAVLAVAKFMQTLEEAYPTTTGAIILDKGAPARRLELAPDYKATRPSMPDELRAQIPVIREWFEAAGWNIIEREGLEADDLIHDIVMTSPGAMTYIISGDKDLAQLVSENVHMLIPGKQKSFQDRGPEEIEAKFSVPPRLVGDYLALIGDTSDNIAGVPGVGPKTAAKLLNEHGSIHSILNNLDAIERKTLREKLASHKEQILKSRLLVALGSGEPANATTLKKLQRPQPDFDRLIEMATELELKSLIKSLEKAREKFRSPMLFDEFELS